MKPALPAPSALGQCILAAIVFTDCVGFSARMSANEEQTLRLIKRDLALMSDRCQPFEGRVLKSTGDGLLISFASALQAVQWAIDCQQTLAETAKTLPTQEVLQHRIGIHLGDVFFSETDVMGNGVNIAARLEAKAAPGGICISQTVYDVVKDRLDVEATPLGALELKNIREPIQAYQLLRSSQPPIAAAVQPRSPSETQQQYRDRQILINKVQTFWVKGVLETSLHGRAMLELGLQEHQDAIDHPWGLSWQTLNTSQQPFPEHSNAIDLFDQLGTGRTLLILGEPGSGKTTTLLQLTRTLLTRADQNPTLPVPVVFNLSSWMERQSLADWLVVELDTKYQVPRKIGKTWVKDQQMLLMLDGLDEVKGDRREACVQAINRFHQEHHHTEIVVCSRIRDYEALSNHLQFQGAVLIQPLNPDQIESYLACAGDNLSGLQEVLPTDSQLQELVKSPLMLSVMSIAYQGMSATDLIRSSLMGDYVKPLFDIYIQRMLSRRTDRRYSPEQTQRWLTRLATQLTQESQTVFLIEQMQPTWLKLGWFSWLYGTATGLIFSGVLVILVCPSLIIPILESMNIVDVNGVYTEVGASPPLFITAITNTSKFLRTPVLVGPLILVSPLLEGFLWGGFYQSARQRITKLIAGLVFVLLSGAVWGGIPLLTYKLISTEPPPSVEISLVGGFIGLLWSLLGGFIGLLLWSLLKKPIIPAETFKWSWQRARKKAVAGAVWGLLYGILAGLSSSLLDLMNIGSTFIPTFQVSESIGNSTSSTSSSWLIPIISVLVLCLMNCLVLGIILQLLGGFIGGLIGGLTSQSIKTTTRPNQGIWQIIPNTLILGVVGAGLGEMFGKLVGLPVGVGAWTGLSLGLFNGCDALIKHTVLRLLLWCNRATPWNYARFLNYATHAILLQRVGGGYVFIHRMLLEHFAQMPSRRLPEIPLNLLPEIPPSPP